ncbi:MAG: UvrD-helicase domain-containing protein [Patescibacteria group bacterium]|nr:UvrD-helicase domain-containing protein [Patescibacteria group bacterium]
MLEEYQEKYKYIMVDEYQDTNLVQYEIVKLLASKYRNLAVVGDDSQSIYSWRGADMRNIINFKKDYNDALIVKLEQNYRSTKKIIA